MDERKKGRSPAIEDRCKQESPKMKEPAVLESWSWGREFFIKRVAHYIMYQLPIEGRLCL